MEKQIKYSYCVDENNRLVHISELTNETRHSHQWRCLQCGQEMTPKLGKIKTKHFAHKADTACDGELYLHQLAKRRIREKFESADSFPITFVKDVPCSEHKTCLYYNGYMCKKRNVHIPFNLKEWYNCCEEEIRDGEFIIDLLLTSKTNPNENIYIEIFVTHKSEESKINSDNRIIETTQIKSEDDIEDIIKRGFVEGRNCKIYNFKKDKLKLPSIKVGGVPIERFVLFKNGAATVYKAHEYAFTCNTLNKRALPNSVCELNMKEFGIELWGENAENKILDSYESGLVYLMKKKGWQIKNCILCKFRKYNDFYGIHICTHYKSLGQDYRFPQQTKANKCPDYQVDPDKMNYPLSELEKSIDPNIIE